MPALRDLQRAFAAHLAGGAPGDALLHVVQGDAIPAAARLAIHRNHVQASLSAALAATFPTVQTLVGPDFFRRLAGTFVDREMPAGPVLAEYGAALPGFLEAWAPVAGLPYLADIARLDWAMSRAAQEPDSRRLTAADLAARAAEDLPQLVLAMPPGAARLASRFPIDRIWQASQPGAGDATVDLAAGGCAVLVLPDPPGVAFVRLGPGEEAFLASVAEGRALGAAAAAAEWVEDDFALTACFARLLAVGAFAALQ